MKLNTSHTKNLYFSQEMADQTQACLLEIKFATTNTFWKKSELCYNVNSEQTLHFIKDWESWLIKCLKSHKWLEAQDRMCLCYQHLIETTIFP